MTPEQRMSAGRMDDKTWNTALDKVEAKFGTEHIIVPFSRGEPFTNVKGFFQRLDQLEQRGFRYLFCTNGTYKLNDMYFRNLFENRKGLVYVAVSLDGTNPQSIEHIRGKESARLGWETARQLLRIRNEYRTDTLLATTAVRMQQPFQEIQDFVHVSLGLGFDFTVIRNLYTDKKLPVSHDVGPMCKFDSEYLVITYNGNVYKCERSPWRPLLGNINTMSIEELQEKARRTDHEGCKGCSYPATGNQWKGKLNGYYVRWDYFNTIFSKTLLGDI
jgi:MoaA/NifB/PqqE/SkfB family radical SAM enzyme